MATAGKVPFLGFKATIRNVVLLGFGAGASATVPLPPVRLATVESLQTARTVDSQQPSRAVSSGQTHRTVRGIQ